jgi:hypothetical protein
VSVSGAPQLVFISHTKTQQGLAEGLGRALREVGMEPWLANEAITPGDAVRESIAEAIERAPFIVLIIQAEPPTA